LEGFQLWINLPASNKMVEAAYQDVQRENIPEFINSDGIKVRVIAGSCQGVAGAIQRPATQPLFLDVHFPENSRFALSLPSEHNAFFYVYRGEVSVAGFFVNEQHLAVLDNAKTANGLILQASQASRIVLIAGMPLNEPIVQHGPFVMNTQEQILQAIADFNAGRFGE